MSARASSISARRFADLVLFGVTALELGLLVLLARRLTVVDWIYVLQHVLVLGIALIRRAPAVQDRSLAISVAVGVVYTYPYAQVVYLRWMPGRLGWPLAGGVLVTVAAGLGLWSLLVLGRWFGVRPALRGLATTGPYGLVRHPLYLAHVIGDVGYNLQEWNVGTLLLVLAGWISLVYRIHAEERVLAHDSGWKAYAERVRARLIPGVW